jgi:hypothetical protein
MLLKKFIGKREEVRSGFFKEMQILVFFTIKQMEGKRSVLSSLLRMMIG